MIEKLRETVAFCGLTRHPYDENQHGLLTRKIKEINSNDSIWIFLHQ